jgi:hypothetical protein
MVGRSSTRATNRFTRARSAGGKPWVPENKSE